MDNTLVSARVSKAKKDAVSGVLRSIGATTTELINSAFDYVLAERKLPACGEVDVASVGEFRSFVADATVAVDWDEDANLSYKDIMRRERLADYESLA